MSTTIPKPIYVTARTFDLGATVQAAANENLPAGAVLLAIPYGEYPHARGLQVLDREAANAMAEAFRLPDALILRAGRGLPAYVGHPDLRGSTPEETRDIAARYPDKRSYGRILDIIPAENELRLAVAWNEAGRRILANEEYAYFSPYWGLLPVPGRAGAFRPAELISIGLTNHPNIPGLGVRAHNEAQNNDNTGTETMRLEAIALLRKLGKHIGEAATETEVAGLLTTAANEVGATAANVSELTVERDRWRGLAIANELDGAVNDGRITAAQRPAWEKNLERDFAGNSELLRGLKPAANTVVNPAVAALGGAKGNRPVAGEGAEGNAPVLTAAERIAAANEKVGEYLAAHPGVDRGKAVAAVYAANPELSQKAA